MFKKSFISICFLSDRLLIAEVGKNKKHLKAYLSFEIPKGLIENYTVTDTAKLAAVLRSAWSELKLHEKAVGLILPEFSSFTKYFKIPKLTSGELNEAVTWQAQEYLPSNLKDMVMDWKMISEESGGSEVLIVAAEKNILSGYVKACESAGLFPMSVEIPSICLTRLSAKNTGGVLSVYQIYTETILVISLREKIIGTSVIKEGDNQEIVKTASRMVTHYRDVKVENIMVGGLIDKELPEKLARELDVKVAPLKSGLAGNENTLQEYLILISQQLAEPAEPSDPHSLNLLPAGLVEKYKYENLKIQVWGLTLTISLFVWTSFMVTVGAYTWMLQQLDEMKEANLTSQVAQQRQKALTDVKFINKISKTTLAIKSVSTLPQEIFNAVYRAKPLGVEVEAWQVDMDKGAVSLNGVANDRSSLISFKENLEKNPAIGYIRIPISSFEKDVNLDYQVQFNYLPITSKIAVTPKPNPTEGGFK